ncbi:hypothetical protein M406DRAFT_357113 [Cryphonectria parasitica EP155]|uniref:Uncharacterized protein n=1 Tax=Cryphonectria parasitica (strain ATCC 38755 / EP155) TaxID=660469 RepID=A0A9P4XZ29_CRYP1|nr:uncharacterized protein M406DRAFT_357113 [Cryphonectria parasitica EP155]KAF3763541.1 hypothetical protein M406DRAFT_357113 [Cryphonectria parasitica EP155]
MATITTTSPAVQLIMANSSQPIVPTAGEYPQPTGLPLWQAAYRAIRRDRTRAAEFRSMQLTDQDRSRLEQIIFLLDFSMTAGRDKERFYRAWMDFTEDFSSPLVNAQEFAWILLPASSVVGLPEPFPPLDDLALIHGFLEKAGGWKDTYLEQKRGIRDNTMLDNAWMLFSPEGLLNMIDTMSLQQNN